QSRAEQRLGRHLDALGEQHEMAHVHDLRRLLERIGEAALRNAPDEGHLAALEPGAHLAALPRGLSLPTASCGFPDPRSRTPALTNARAVRAAGWLQIMQRQPRELGLGTGGLGLPPRLPCRFRFSSWHLPSFLLSPTSPRRGGAPDRACPATPGDPHVRLRLDDA